jgi:hypothetical protein
VWPFQLVLNILAVVMIFLSFNKMIATDKINSSILAFFWIWMGLAYHLIHFTSINNAAYIFGTVFILQGVLFIYSGILKNDISFNFTLNAFSFTGSVFILYALLLYPILGYIFGHAYPKLPTFGLPCPTTIFTFGILFFTDKKIPKYLLIIPVLWSIIGFSAAYNLSVHEDYGLFIAGIVGVILIILRDRQWYNQTTNEQLSKV